MFEKLNTRCFNWEVGLLDALFLITEKISSWRSPTPIMAHLAWFSCLTHSSRVLRVLQKRETSAVEAPARNSRARGLGLKTNQYGDKKCTSVVKLETEWHYLDFRNSDLISIGSLTHSLTLDFIYDFNIHGCGMPDVVKISLWGKLMFN